MGTADDTEQHNQGRAAMLAVQAALATLQQHPDADGLWRPALRRAVYELGRVTTQAPLTISLRAGSLHVDDEPVLSFRRDQAPFGLLRAAGIGEIAVDGGTPGEVAERLILRLAALSGNDDGALAALLAADDLPGVEWRAASDAAAGPDEQAMWAALPPPSATSVGVRAIVQRDSASNLPALAARQLLDDCETFGWQHGDALERLMARMLVQSDVGTAAWLLTEVQRQPCFDHGIGERLMQMARERCDDAWLQALIERGTRTQLLQLSALAMHLGEQTAARFAATAAAAAHPLSQWLAELLGQPQRG